MTTFLTMAKRAESTARNACKACASSKRKCGRQMPSCARCADRDVPCVYPTSSNRAASSSRLLAPSTLRDPVSGIEDGLHTVVAGGTSARTAGLTLADELMSDLAFSLLDNDYPAPSSLFQTPNEPTTGTDWFLAPETWKICHRVAASASVADSITEAVSRATVKKHVAILQSWFERWVTTGSNPFIHRCLYSKKFPACVQIAYVTLASYIHRNPANTDAVLQIVEDRSNDLLQENGAVVSMAGTVEWVDREEQDTDVFAQLTRLHALLVYQIIGLFDGDIRSRYVAESQMAIRDSWADKLFHSAARTLSNNHEVATQLVCLPNASTNLQEQWHLWILSESIRRTWFVAVSLSSVFYGLQQRWSTCPGSIMYTNRNGLWNATSATEWERQCLAKSVAFLQRYEYAKLLEHTEPADIDEFGAAMLDMTLKKELLETWRDRWRGL
jgi:hypothetical protein